MIQKKIAILFSLLVLLGNVKNNELKNPLFSSIYYFPKDFILYNFKVLSSLKYKTLIDKTNNYTIYINTNTKFLPTDPLCKDNKKNFVFLVNTVNNNCVSPFNFKEDDKDEKDYNFYFDYLDSANKENGVKVTQKDSLNNVNFSCTKEDNLEVNVISLENITLLHKDFCGIELEFIKYIAEHDIILKILIIVFGFLFSLFGGCKWDKFIILIGVITGLLIMFVIYFIFIPLNFTTSKLILFIILMLISASLFGFLFYISKYIPLISLSIFSGYLLAKLVFGLTKEKVKFSLYFPVLIIVISIIIIAFALKFRKTILIILTSLIGSPLFIYPLFTLFLKIDDIWVLIANIETKDSISTQEIITASFIIIWIIISMIFQFYLKNKKDQKQKHLEQNIDLI